MNDYNKIKYIEKNISNIQKAISKNSPASTSNATVQTVNTIMENLKAAQKNQELLKKEIKDKQRSWFYRPQQSLGIFVEQVRIFFTLGSWVNSSFDKNIGLSTIKEESLKKLLEKTPETTWKSWSMSDWKVLLSYAHCMPDDMLQDVLKTRALGSAVPPHVFSQLSKKQLEFLSTNMGKDAFSIYSLSREQVQAINIENLSEAQKKILDTIHSDSFSETQRAILEETVKGVEKNAPPPLQKTEDSDWLLTIEEVVKDETSWELKILEKLKIDPKLDQQKIVEKFIKSLKEEPTNIECFDSTESLNSLIFFCTKNNIHLSQYAAAAIFCNEHFSLSSIQEKYNNTFF